MAFGTNAIHGSNACHTMTLYQCMHTFSWYRCVTLQNGTTYANYGMHSIINVCHTMYIWHGVPMHVTLYMAW